MTVAAPLSNHPTDPDERVLVDADVRPLDRWFTREQQAECANEAHLRSVPGYVCVWASTSVSDDERPALRSIAAARVELFHGCGDGTLVGLVSGLRYFLPMDPRDFASRLAAALR